MLPPCSKPRALACLQLPSRIDSIFLYERRGCSGAFTPVPARSSNGSSITHVRSGSISPCFSVLSSSTTASREFLYCRSSHPPMAQAQHLAAVAGMVEFLVVKVIAICEHVVGGASAEIHQRSSNAQIRKRPPCLHDPVPTLLKIFHIV